MVSRLKMLCCGPSPARFGQHEVLRSNPIRHTPLTLYTNTVSAYCIRQTASCVSHMHSDPLLNSEVSVLQLIPHTHRKAAVHWKALDRWLLLSQTSSSLHFKTRTVYCSLTSTLTTSNLARGFYLFGIKYVGFTHDRKYE